MEHNNQFIRLDCDLMANYQMMKMHAEMKSKGLGMFLNVLLFLRKQEDYKHNINGLDFLAMEWGASVEELLHLIQDFDLFEIAEDGSFHCLYLDELMERQHRLSEQRAACGSKGGKTTKKSIAKTAKTTASKTATRANGKAVVRTADKAVKETSEETIGSASENTSENAPENAPENDGKSVKNMMKKSDEKKNVQNSSQSVGNQVDNMHQQANFKQNSIREEKKREEKKKDLETEKEKIDEDAAPETHAPQVPRWEQYIDEAFAAQIWLDTVGMLSGLKERFLNNIPFICSVFKQHVVAQGSAERINSLSDAKNYFANYVRPGRPTHVFLEEKLNERFMAQKASATFSPYENYDPQTGVRSYYGIPLPQDAPPRPNGRVNWDPLKKRWI